MGKCLPGHFGGFRVETMKKPPRRGPISWIRRRVLPKVSRLLVVVVLLLLATWTAGQVLTDQYALSQYLWWMPTPLVLFVAWPMIIVSWVVERLSSRLGGYQLRPLLSAALLGITLWFVFGVGHVYRYVLPSRAGSVRLVYWNLAVDDEATGAGDVVSQLTPDIAIVANPRWDETRGPLLDAMRAMGGAGASPEAEPSESESLPSSGQAEAGSEAIRFVFSNEIAIATRGQILRWGSARFSADGRDDFEHRGVIVFAEVAELMPEPITIWIVDLPSAPALWRVEVMEQAVQAIGSWSGPDFVPGDGGRWVRRTDAEPFPDADLIVGDFNTPRGSASLETLVGSRRNASVVAGRGFGYTWPREHAILAIDHCFAGPRLRVQGFRSLDPGMGRHRLLMADLDPN